MEFLGNIGKYLWLKAIGALAGVFGINLFIVTDEHERVLLALMLLVMIDSILGIWSAVKMRRLASWRMGKPMAGKVVLYGFALMVVFIMAGAFDHLFSWAPTYLTLFFCLSELLSVFEKLSLLGLQLPVRMVSRVNELFEKMMYGDKKATRDIMEKN